MIYLLLIPVIIAALALVRRAPGCSGSCQQGRKTCDCMNRE